ncbi:M14 family zinc carboxypeptidase, partial [Klebsiella pneumoniae]
FSGIRLPSYLIELGARDPAKPNLLLVGGVHGLERIGSAVLIAFLESLQNRLNWDQTLADSLSQLNLYLLPMVNPVG